MIEKGDIQEVVNREGYRGKTSQREIRSSDEKRKKGYKKVSLL